jgi:hypothetical protein
VALFWRGQVVVRLLWVASPTTLGIREVCTGPSLVHSVDHMKHPVVVTGSVLLCLMIIISAAIIGLIALNGSRLEESSGAYDE